MSLSVPSEITDNHTTGGGYLSQKTASANLITMHPKEQAAAYNGPAITEAVLKKWGKDGYRARANTLTNSKNIKGLLFLSKSNQLRALYLPQIVTEDDGNTCIVGTMSNHADNPKIRFIPIEALKSCVVVLRKSDGPPGTTWGARPLDVTHDKVSPFFPPENITEGVELFVGKVAAAMPIPLNTDNITVGDLNDQDVEATPVSIDGEWGANWAYSMMAYDAGLADVLIKEEDLRQYLPATVQTEWADPTNTIYNRPKDDLDDGAIEMAEDKIVAICKQIVSDNDKDSNSTVATATGNLGTGNMVNALESFTSRLEEVSSKAKPAQLQATKARALGSTLLMYAHIARDKNGDDTLILPEASETLTHIVDHATSTREMSKLFESGLKTTGRTMEKSDHYILKNVNMPKIQPAVLGYMAIGAYHTSTISSLCDTNLTGLAPICLIPDTKDSSKKKNDNETSARIEEAMGEFDEKRTKIDTSITQVGKLTRLVDLMQTLANELLVIRTKVKFDVGRMKEMDMVPFPVYAISTLCSLLTTKKAKDFFTANDGEVKGAALCMAVLFRYTSICTDLAEGLCSDQDICSAATGVTEGVPLEPYRDARVELDLVERDIKMAFRAGDIAKSPFFENSDTKKTYERNKVLKMKAELAQTRPSAVTPPNNNKGGGGKNGRGGNDNTDDATKRQKTHNDVENLGNDGRDGYIIKSADAAKPGFTLPAELDTRGPGNFALCKNLYSKGRNCRFGKSCRNCHKAPNKLPGDKKQILWDFMGSDAAKEQGLTWNSKYVDAKIMTEAGVNTKGSSD